MVPILNFGIENLEKSPPVNLNPPKLVWAIDWAGTFVWTAEIGILSSFILKSIADTGALWTRLISGVAMENWGTETAETEMGSLAGD